MLTIAWCIILNDYDFALHCVYAVKKINQMECFQLKNRETSQTKVSALKFGKAYIQN